MIDAIAQTGTAAAAGDAATRAQLALELDTLTSHHAPLIAALIQEKKIPSFQDLARLALDLACGRHHRIRIITLP